MSLECRQLTHTAENATVLATFGAKTKQGSTIGNRYLLEGLVASFGALWDDEALLPRHRGSTSRSLQRFSKREKMSEHVEWDADPDEYEEEEQEWVEEADAYCGNDDEWDEDFRGTFWIAGNGRSSCHHRYGNCFFRHLQFSTQFHGRQEVGGSGDNSHEDSSSSWSGCCRRVVINDTTCLL